MGSRHSGVRVGGLEMGLRSMWNSRERGWEDVRQAREDPAAGEGQYRQHKYDVTFRNNCPICGEGYVQ